MIRLPALVDVLIVNYRTPDLTTEAVASLAGADVRFLIRDNSGDIHASTLSAVAGPDSRLVRDGRNTLYAAANNEIYAQGTAPYVLLLNPDVIITRASLLTLLNSLTSDADLWAVVPRLLNSDGSPQAYYRRFPTLGSIVCDRFPPARAILRPVWRRHIYAGESFQSRRAVEAPPGACILFRRADVGDRLFDERLRLFFSDTELSLRMSRAGKRVDVVPEATATHVRGASLEQARRQDRFLVASLYDRDCFAYARSNIRGWPLVLALVLLRQGVERVLRPLRRTTPR